MKNTYAEREVCGDECAVRGCPYEHDGDSSYCSYHQKDFPSIAEVCELFDVEVLTDLFDIDDANPNAGGPFVVYFLGQNPELAAGLRGFTMTPHFKTTKELESFCKRHIERFRAVTEDAPAPDATGWE